MLAIKRNRKKKMREYKKKIIKKVLQERNERLLRINLVLASIEGGLNIIEDKKDFLTKKEISQLEKIKRWLEPCWNDVRMELDKKTYKRAVKLLNKMQNRINYYYNKHLGEIGKITGYTWVWFINSMLLDDVVLFYNKSGKHWRYLKQVVATWLAMLLDQEENPEFAEEIGGKLQQEVWDIILNK